MYASYAHCPLSTSVYEPTCLSHRLALTYLPAPVEFATAPDSAVISPKILYKNSINIHMHISNVLQYFTAIS